MTATAVAAGAVVVGVAVATPGEPTAPPLAVTTVTAAPPAPPAPPVPAAITVDGRPLLPLPPGDDLAPWAGREVEVRAARVLSVDADEGFWIGEGDTQRLWVQLVTPVESGQQVRAGDAVTFTGQVVANGAGFPERAGVDPAEGADLLEREGHHLEAEAVRVQVG